MLGTAFCILGYKRLATKDIQEDSSMQTSFKMQLDYISKGIDDIKSEMRDMKIDAKATDKALNELMERVTRVEESSKQAHKRIDELEKVINNLRKVE
jgi:peptidoglycan hydrolase CwlO-like protein